MNVKRLLISLFLLIISNNLIVFSEPLISDIPIVKAEEVGQLDTTVIYAVYADNGFSIDIKTEEYQKALEQEQVENDKWAMKEAEYPAATAIWKYLTDNGYSEAVTAGILGNMMTEVGGWTGNAATMNLDVCNSGKVYYGLCQWKKRGYPGVVGLDLTGQLNFLLSTIQAEYADFGRRCSGYSYEEFLNITDPAVAALSFAKTYERCGSSSYKRRQRCAQIAFEYFTSN